MWSHRQAIASILQLQITNWTIRTSCLNQHIAFCWKLPCLSQGIMQWSVNLLWCAATVFRCKTFSPIGEVSELPDPSAFLKRTHTFSHGSHNQACQPQGMLDIFFWRNLWARTGEIWKGRMCLYHSIVFYIWLVVWNMPFIFPYIGNVIIPIDFPILQRGWNHQPDIIFLTLQSLPEKQNESVTCITCIRI